MMASFIRRPLYRTIYRYSVSIFVLHYVQQFLHEFGHATTCLLLGGRVLEFIVEFPYSYVVCEFPATSVANVTVHLSGGLLVLYHYTKWWWVEFTTINLMYILSNLFTAVVEGFFNEAYLRYLEIWSLMTLLFFFLALRLNPRVKWAGFSERSPKMEIQV
jgi:hypothetical protein